VGLACALVGMASDVPFYNLFLRSIIAFLVIFIASFALLFVAAQGIYKENLKKDKAGKKDEELDITDIL